MNFAKKNQKITFFNIVMPFTLISAIFLSGCSGDDGYTRKVRGTDDYLGAPAPKSLNIPASVSVPAQNADLEIQLPAQQGNFGYDVDISPPSVGLTTAEAGSEAQFAQESYSEELYTGSVNVLSGSDETGLPVIIVEQGYDATWQTLPGVLKKAGFEISEQNETLGKLTVDFNGTDSNALPTMQVESGEYVLQVGDLGNRTSLQFRNAKNTYLTQAQNDALQKLFQSKFNQ